MRQEVPQGVSRECGDSVGISALVRMESRYDSQIYESIRKPVVARLLGGPVASNHLFREIDRCKAAALQKKDSAGFDVHLSTLPRWTLDHIVILFRKPGNESAGINNECGCQPERCSQDQFHLNQLKLFHENVWLTMPVHVWGIQLPKQCPCPASKIPVQQKPLVAPGITTSTY